jgi:hypothetical protein
VDGPLDLAVPAAGDHQNGQLAQAGRQERVVAHELAQALGAVGQFRAVEPDAEGAGNVAARGEDGVVDALLAGIELISGQFGDAAHGKLLWANNENRIIAARRQQE